MPAFLIRIAPVALFITSLVGWVVAADSAPAGSKEPATEVTDVRLQPLKDLNGYFPFDPPKSKEAWAARAATVRRQVLVANGLWPLPTKTPLNAVVHGRVDRPDFTVDRVILETVPGHFLCGSLF